MTEQEELHNMQLAAIMTASIQNTESTVKERIGKDNPYWTVAYDDTCKAVDREIRERNRAQQYRVALVIMMGTSPENPDDFQKIKAVITAEPPSDTRTIALFCLQVLEEVD